MEPDLQCYTPRTVIKASKFNTTPETGHGIEDFLGIKKGGEIIAVERAQEESNEKYIRLVACNDICRFEFAACLLGIRRQLGRQH